MNGLSLPKGDPMTIRFDYGEVVAMKRWKFLMVLIIALLLAFYFRGGCGDGGGGGGSSLWDEMVWDSHYWE